MLKDRWSLLLAAVFLLTIVVAAGMAWFSSREEPARADAPCYVGIVAERQDGRWGMYLKPVDCK